MFFHNATRKLSPICKISTFFADHSFLSLGATNAEKVSHEKLHSKFNLNSISF